MRDDKAQFIVIDGIAGSGKSTLIRAIKKQLEDEGLKIFDLAEWTKENDVPPLFGNIDDYDVYFTFEPSKHWVGAAIRFELSHNHYTGLAHAHAFSLDRQIQYNRLILPALVAGKIIIQDRSVSSSIVYQPIMEGGPKLEELIDLPGNALTLEFPPDHLILTHIDPVKLHERLTDRDDDSKGVFENVEYLKKVNDRFRSEWFSKIFTDRGTCVHDFSTDLPKEEMKNKMQQIISSIIT